MRPSEVLDAQGDLMERLGIPEFVKTINALAEFEFGRSGGRAREYQGSESTPLGQMMASCLKAAHTYRVTHDMAMLVEHASKTLDDLDRFDHSLAPTGCGFVAFDRPLPVMDMRGKTMLIHYLIWGPIGVHVNGRSEQPATLMVAFNDTWRQPDQVQEAFHDGILMEFLGDGVPEKEALEVIERHKVALGRWASVGASAFVDGMRLGPALAMPDEDDQARLLAEGDQPTPGTNVIRYLHALWLMMEQTVAKVETEQVDRKARRRAERRKLPPKVSVIKLRREQGHYERREGESTIEWAHRWVVKGHWRWQAVGEHHPLAQEVEPGKFRARIWINPYAKNAHRSDLPWVQSEKVYSLER